MLQKCSITVHQRSLDQDTGIVCSQCKCAVRDIEYYGTAPAQKPTTVNGVKLSVVVPLPSSPWELLPQHRIEPELSTAQV